MFTSAATSRSSRPVTKQARLCAWVPMSATVPPGPERAGSVRHSACFWPVASNGVASQSCGYSTWTTRSRPRAPAATRALASRTIG